MSIYTDDDSAIAMDEDLPFEEDVMRNIYDFRSWWRYLQFKGDAPTRIRFMLYERALKELPGSYKLWYNYLQERKGAVSGLRIDHPAYEQLNNTFERCLAYMHKMPRIWLEYLSLLLTQRKITHTRRAFDRALRALPITQHYRIWPLYIQFAKQCGVPETAVRIFRRFLKLEPDHLEEYANYLVSVGYVDEAAKILTRIVNDDHFISRQGKSRHELWMQLCDILTQHPEQIHSVRVEPIIRSALAKYTNEVGKLWTSLADYYVRLGNFEKARDVFEEGINSVVTVRDFSQIWDAYNQFEYGLITAHMEEQQDPALVDAFELRMARFEDLIDRQPLLISNVLLRQNPHNVYEWHKRVKLFDNDPQRKLEEYTRGCTTVDPQRATGKLNTLWVSFARFWEENEQYDDARKVFEKALNVNYKKVEELAAVWTDYVEFELRRLNYDRARELIQRATVVPKNRAIPRDAPVSKRVYKSTRLWALYADLEENLGTFMTTKAVYEKIIDLRLITPQMTINYAHWLEEHNHFEESFKAYERGIALFQFPHVTELWITYLTKFMRRYGGTKLERLRDLFEQAIESAPAKEVTLFYLMYAEAEEKYGLARHVLHIFDRATRHVHAEDRPFIFNLYIAKATEFFGVTRTREIFEKAIESLPEKQVREYCFRFANLERKLGEIDRARAIYIHCSQFCDPRTEQKFWETWKEFEVRHGNVETFKEMLRIKRSVTAQYSIAVQVPLTVAAPKSTDQEDHMKQLEEQQGGAAPAKRFVSGSTLQPEELGMAPSEAAANARPATSANTEEIELDMDEGEQEEEEEEEAPKPKKNVQLEEIRIPSAVFGGLVDESARDEDNNGDAQGAKDRLKKRKRGPNH